VSTERREESSRALVKTWDELFAEMLDRKAETGTLDAGKSHDLKEWLHTQREQFKLMKAGQTSQLTSDQVSKLSTLGIDEPTASSSPSASDEEQQKPQAQATSQTTISTGEKMQFKTWEQWYTELLTHRLTHNSFQVPTANPLHRWTQEQRIEYEKYTKGFPSVLTNERITKLNFVGFPWKEDGPSVSTDPSKSWEEMFAELLAFRVRFQSFEVPQENYQLHGWMEMQRIMLEKHLESVDESDLVEERVRKLQEVGFPWDDQGPCPGVNGHASTKQEED